MDENELLRLEINKTLDEVETKMEASGIPYGEWQLNREWMNLQDLLRRVNENIEKMDNIDEKIESIDEIQEKIDQLEKSLEASGIPYGEWQLNEEWMQLKAQLIQRANQKENEVEQDKKEESTIVYGNHGQVKDLNADGWEFNPWINEYDAEYNSDNDEQLYPKNEDKNNKDNEIIGNNEEQWKVFMEEQEKVDKDDRTTGNTEDQLRIFLENQEKDEKDPNNKNRVIRAIEDPETENDLEQEIETKSELPLKSGLQIYRQLLNEGPEFKRSMGLCYGRLSEMPIVGLLANNFITRRAFGAKRYQKEMYVLISELPIEDYNLMVSYLMEDNNSKTLKVPMPFLKALHKANADLIKANDPELTQDGIAIKNEKRELIQKQKELRSQLINNKNLTQDEKIAIHEEINRCDSEKLQLEEEFNALKGATDTLENYKNSIELAQDYRSFRKRDNYSYFGKRQYNNIEEINKLADIELGKLKAQATGNKSKEIDAEMEMNDYMESNTKKGKFLFIPYETGAFYKPEDEITIKTSNRNENRPKMILYTALGAYGAIKSAYTILSNKELMDQMYQSIQQVTGNMSPEMAKNAINSITQEMNSLNGTAEYANLEGNLWNTATTGYKAADSSHHQLFEQLGQGLGARIDAMNKMADTNPTGAIVEALKCRNEILGNMPAEVLAKGVAEHGKTWSLLPHGMQEIFANNAVAGKEGTIMFNQMLIDYLGKAEALKSIPAPGKADLLGPIVSAVTVTAKGIDDLKNSFIHKNTKKEKIEEQIDIDEEEQEQ